MRNLTFSFFYYFFSSSFLFVASFGLAACSLPEGGSHARCSAETVCAQGLVCYRTFCVEPSQAADASAGGGDDVPLLPGVDAQVLDAAAQTDAGETLPPMAPRDAGEDTDAQTPSTEAGAPSDAGSTPAQPDAQVALPDAQVALPDAQVARPDASMPVDAGSPQDAGPVPCKGKKCCKGGEKKPCDDDKAP